MNGGSPASVLTWMAVGGLGFAGGDLLPFEPRPGLEAAMVRALIGLIVGGLQWKVLQGWVGAHGAWVAVTVVAFASSPLAFYLEATDEPHLVPWQAGALVSGAVLAPVPTQGASA